MTARKVHFDFNAEGTHAFCGATPREGAPALELSERRKDVDCIKCLNAMNDYDAEHEAGTATMIQNLANSNVFDDKDGDEFDEIDEDWNSTGLYQTIADRHGLYGNDVKIGFEAGWLKR